MPEKSEITQQQASQTQETSPLSGIPAQPLRQPRSPPPLPMRVLAPATTSLNRQPRNPPQPLRQLEVSYPREQTTFSIVKYLLKASLFYQSRTNLAIEILAKPYIYDSGHPNTRKYIIRFYTRFSGLYTRIRGIARELNALGDWLEEVLSSRHSTFDMILPSWAKDEARFINTDIPLPEKGECVVLPKFLKNFAGWTDDEIDAFFATPALRKSHSMVEKQLKKAIAVFWRFTNDLAGIQLPPGSPTRPETLPGIYPLLSVEEQIDDAGKAVRDLAKKIGEVGRKCPDWYVYEEGPEFLPRRVQVPGHREAKWRLFRVAKKETSSTGTNNWCGEAFHYTITKESVPYDRIDDIDPDMPPWEGRDDIDPSTAPEDMWVMKDRVNEQWQEDQVKRAQDLKAEEEREAKEATNIPKEEVGEGESKHKLMDSWLDVLEVDYASEYSEDEEIEGAIQAWAENGAACWPKVLEQANLLFGARWSESCLYLWSRPTH
ncbi:hypothetical protein V8F20_005985 [Naviculisporaceae sp. PSN 640]